MISLSWLSIPVIAVVSIYTALWCFLTIVYLLPKKAVSTDKLTIHPKVSVIVPACDEESVVKSIIRDIDDQIYRKLELIVVAHNCADNTYEVACGVKAKIDVKVYKLMTEESGKALALQYALKRATGDIVAFFDADNHVPNDFIIKALSYFQNGYDGIQARILSKNPSQNVLTSLQHSEFLIYPKAYCGGKMRLGFNSGIGGTGIMFRRLLLEDIGGFRNLLIEDFDITLRLTMKGYRVAYAEDVVTYDEKVSNFKSLIKQRARWLAGYFQLWRVFTLREKLSLLRYPIDFIYYVNPVCLIALLLNYLLSALSLFGFIFVSAPFWWWVGNIILINSLFTVSLKEESISTWKKLLLPYQVTVFMLHWFVALFYSFKIKSWSQTKTEHGKKGGDL